MKNLNQITTIVAVVLSLALIITGICFLTSDPGYYGTSVPADYSFGADFYTESYGAIRAVASNTATVARNARELNEIVASVAGWAFLFAGLFSLLNSGKKLAEMLLEMTAVSVETAAVEQVAPVAVQEVADESDFEN